MIARGSQEGIAFSMGSFASLEKRINGWVQEVSNNKCSQDSRIKGPVDAGNIHLRYQLHFLLVSKMLQDYSFF